MSAYAAELAPEHRPLAHPSFASGLGNLSAYAAGLAPQHRPLAHPSLASGLGNLSAYAAGFVKVNDRWGKVGRGGGRGSGVGGRETGDLTETI